MTASKSLSLVRMEPAGGFQGCLSRAKGMENQMVGDMDNGMNTGVHRKIESVESGKT